MPYEPHFEFNDCIDGLLILLDGRPLLDAASFQIHTIRQEFFAITLLLLPLFFGSAKPSMVAERSTLFSTCGG